MSRLLPNRSAWTAAPRSSKRMTALSSTTFRPDTFSIERHPRPAIPPARAVPRVYFDTRDTSRCYPMRIPVRYFESGACKKCGRPERASAGLSFPHMLVASFPSLLRSRSAESSRHVLDNCPGSNPIDTPIPTKDWSRRFDTPIALPDGRVLRTLLDAGGYIHGLSDATYQRSE